jgi:hypothetical protein
MRETAKAQEAFNDYYAMGPERSIPKLAEQYRSSIGAVPTRQLSRLLLWSQRHNWQQRIKDLLAQERERILAEGIADLANRVKAQNERHKKMERLIEARAEAFKDLVGGDTGLVILEEKFLPGGAVVKRHEFDAALSRELRELEKHTAQEMGQWAEKQVQEHSGEVNIIHGVDDDAARRLADLIARGITAADQASSGA